MNLRLRFWMLIYDITQRLGWRRFEHWSLRHASDATEWDEGACLGEGEPF